MCLHPLPAQYLYAPDLFRGYGGEPLADPTEMRRIPYLFRPVNTAIGKATAPQTSLVYEMLEENPGPEPEPAALRFNLLGTNST